MAELLTWDDLCNLPTWTDSFGNVRPTLRLIYLAGVPAVVVPTRMHEPGWYIRSGNHDNLSRYWNLRSDQDYQLIRQLCAAGAITAREDGPR